MKKWNGWKKKKVGHKKHTSSGERNTCEHPIKNEGRLDTNILLQAVAHKSRLRPIWTAFLEDKFSMHLTSAILLEYEELLAQRASFVVAESIISLLRNARNVHFIDVYYEWNAIAVDHDDNKFFDAAVASNADYLVSNDNHFNGAKNLAFPQLKIISAEEFLQMLSSLK